MAAAIVTALAADVLRRIDETREYVGIRGWALVPTGVQDRANALALLEELAREFGGLIPHTEDAQIADITTAVGFNDRSMMRPQSDNGPQFPHTDAVLSPELPAVVAMLCLNRAAAGGHSILVDVRPFLAEHGPGGFVDTLFDPEAVAIERGELSSRVSVLRRRGSFVDTALSDHEYNIAVPKPEAAAAFAALWSFAAVPDNQDRILLESGDLLLVANRFCLHGREGFTDGLDGVRHFVRAWFRGAVPATDAFDGYAVTW